MNGKKINSTALGFINGKTGVNTMVNGGNQRCTGSVDTSSKTKSFMKVNIMVIKNMVTESTLGQMVASIKVTGKMVSSMVSLST